MSTTRQSWIAEAQSAANGQTSCTSRHEPGVPSAGASRARQAVRRRDCRHQNCCFVSSEMTYLTESPMSLPPERM